MMGDMHIGRRILRPAVVLALVAPALAGCGLFDRGSTVDDAFEYLPADTFSVTFADRAAMAERLGIDGLDPRDLSDADLDDYTDTLKDEEDNAVAVTTLTRFVDLMQDAAINDLDVVWEAHAVWGDPASPDGSAFVWKVGDDLDFDDLAGELEDKGYEEGDSQVYSVDESKADEYGIVDGTYPAFVMPHALLDEDEEVVVVATEVESLEDIAEVIADDADSLADDGSFDDLLDAADGDPEFALLRADGDSGCVSTELAVREDLVDIYEDLRRAERRALFVSGDDSEVLLALQHESEQAAEDDLEARDELLETGPDPQTGESFDDLGDFKLTQEGEFVLIEEDYDDGARQAFTAEVSSGGLGTCLPEGTS
jgi:hypothetical protein